MKVGRFTGRVIATGFGLAVFVILLAGCASPSPAPIEQKSADVRQQLKNNSTQPAPVPRARDETTYVVVAGDTLHSIAWRFRLDPHNLVRWNNLANPNRILVGQRLRVKPPEGGSGSIGSAPATKNASIAPVEQPVRTPVVAAVKKPATNTAATRIASGGLNWHWPAEGKAVRAVSASGSIGLEIKGERGQTIKAAEAGEVVYGGNGLRGYGQLLIIKHDETFLSAYAHNDKLLVAEGQKVNAGQAIAVMGDSEASEVMLHFEIRKGGSAVEPLQYLPQR